MAVVKAAQASLADPWLFGCGRFALAALAFSPALPALARRPALAAASAELGLLAAAGYAAQAWGLVHTTASHTAFISAFTVVLVPLLAATGALGPAAPVSRKTWVAAAIAFAGIAVLEHGGVGSEAGAAADVAAGALLWGWAPEGLAGDAASLASAALFAAQLVRTERHAATLTPTATSADATSAASGVSPGAALVAGQLATLAAVFAALAAASSATSSPATSAALDVASLPWAAWLFTGLVSTAGTLWLEVEALRDVSAPDAALVYATEPVWGAAVAAALLGERWAGATWAGAAMIVGGALFGQLPGGEQSETATADVAAAEHKR